MRIIRYVSILLLHAAALFFVGSCASTHAKSEDSPTGTVGVAPAVRRDLSRNLVLAAEFRPFQEVEIHAKVAGYVKVIYVDVGDHVKQGQLLAVLEIPELQDELKQAAASVRQREAELTRAQHELQRAQSAYSVTHLAYTRLEEVAKTRPTLVAQQEIDDALGKDRVADAQVESARSAVAAAQEQLEVAKANHAKLETMFSYARILAPFTGVITKRYADTGAMIQAGTASQTQAMPLVRIAQNDLLRLVVPAPESIVAQIRVGTPVQVKVPSLHKVIEGRVTRFADSLDLETRTMQTEIDVPNPRLELVPGMYAEASIQLEQRASALSVPIQALDRRQGGASVLVVTPDKTLERRPVELGLETADSVEIVSGLKDNDLVVVSGRGQLQPGEKVNTRQVSATAQPDAGGK